MTWYSRPPTSAAIATMMMPLPTSSGSSPAGAREPDQHHVRRRRARARSTMPYQPMAKGPSWRAMGSGGMSNIRRSVAVGGPRRDPSLYFATVNAEFNWWLLIVGLVVGAGLVWFVVAESAPARGRCRRRRAAARGALAIGQRSPTRATTISPELAERLLALHRAYLEAPPPDERTTARTLRTVAGRRLVRAPR